LWSIGTVLWLRWQRMVIFLELFDDVSRHGDIERAFDVVPLEAYATVEVAVPIFSEFIFFLMQFIRWSMSS
jgi:hypothetical protein